MRLILAWYGLENGYKWQKQPLELFFKKVVLRKFTKFTGKHLWQSLFVNKFERWATASQMRSSKDIPAEYEIMSIHTIISKF